MCQTHSERREDDRKKGAYERMFFFFFPLWPTLVQTSDMFLRYYISSEPEILELKFH